MSSPYGSHPPFDEEVHGYVPIINVPLPGDTLGASTVPNYDQADADFEEEVSPRRDEGRLPME